MSRDSVDAVAAYRPDRSPSGYHVGREEPTLPVNDDLRSPEARLDRFGFYARLREHDPVHWSEPSRAWIVTSHAQVTAAFKDDRLLSADRITPLEAKLGAAQRAAMAEAFDLLRGWMVFRDPPVHEQLRDPVRRVFTPRSMESLAPKVEAIVAELLGELAGQERCDVLRALAFPLPAIVIADLLGVPAEDRDDFKSWSSQLGVIVFEGLERGGSNQATREGAARFTAYFRRLIQRYRERPEDNLISKLIDALPPEQLVGACTLLLFAGHETTTGLIGSGVANLLMHPEQCEKLGRDPELIGSAVEEFLRYDGPVSMVVRVVREDHERGGHKLRAGERVYLGVAGANRDPAVFPDPDRFDITRDPNPHLGFGLGLHFCLGAPLARVETRIAVGRLLERFPALRLETDQLSRASAIVGGGFSSVPVLLR
jgi:cytochrome P450